MRRQTPLVRQIVALPLDVRAWLEQQAELRLTSMNSVILAAVRAAMATDQNEVAA
ncbi:hypothetical protein [Bradyrhizobium sp. HKCCYLR20261]|uniref:hypothetical protein n=1 Tax=Bradyrhizobium sp. HKCCYLR20261 TaxID=3420760 RepID=UPI003EB754EC